MCETFTKHCGKIDFFLRLLVNNGVINVPDITLLTLISCRGVRLSVLEMVLNNILEKCIKTISKL